jgi:hypothetical protein
MAIKSNLEKLTASRLKSQDDKSLPNEGMSILRPLGAEERATASFMRKQAVRSLSLATAVRKQCCFH